MSETIEQVLLYLLFISYLTRNSLKPRISVKLVEGTREVWLEKLSIAVLGLLIPRKALSAEKIEVGKGKLAKLIVSKARAISSVRICRGNKDLIIINIITSLRKY
jgi:hypothetical protein